MEIAKIIIDIRQRLNLTQAELAEKIGKSQPLIAQYEKGNAMPPADVFLKIQRLASDA